MMELCIDTSTRYATVGLCGQGETLAELTWRSERNHSVELVPAIRRLMGHVGVAMSQLDAVFVAQGPGGFSALRVGMSTAKALAEALSIPLVAVGTLDIEAQPFLGLGAPVCALVPAGRTRVYVGKYGEGIQDGGPAREVVSHGELLASLDANALFCGEGLREVADAIRQRLGREALLAEVPPPTRRASVMSHLGYRRWQSGMTDDPATLQPVYLRSAQVDTAHRTWVSS